MRNGEIIFIEAPHSLKEEMDALSGEENETGFKADTSIPLPIELNILDFSDSKEKLSEKLSWEMILSGMIQVVSEGSDVNGIKPHWIDYYRRFVLALKPEIYNEFTGAALVKARNGDFDEALEIIKALEGLFPFSPELLLNKALILEGKAEELEKIGLEIEAESENEKALEAYGRALGLKPVLPELLYSAGFFFFRRKYYAQAREYFSQYIEFTEDFEDTWDSRNPELPQFQKNPDKKQKAEAIVREIENQGLDDDRFLEALDLIRQGSENEALYAIRDFLEDHPRVPNAWFVLGWALRKLGRWQDARESFEKACEFGITGSDVRNETAICLMELGKFSEARKELEAALRKEPENLKIISNLGVLALKSNNREEASGFFRTALELNPRDPLAREFFKIP